MMARSFILAAMALALAGGCQTEAGNAAGETIGRHAESGLEIIPLEIREGGKVHRFKVEVARSEDEQAKGLMYRQNLGPDEGMLFPFSPPRPASFWMKNTLIPLDLLFVRGDGSIARIADNAVPMSLEQIAVGEPVVAVLELAGGRAAELGLTEAARVSWAGGPK
jgi:hypothetical protein